MDLIFGRPDFADAARAQHNGFLLTNGLGGYSALSAAFSAICRIGRRIDSLPLSGAKRRRLASLGSSMLTERRSASKPSRAIKAGSAPGIALAWIYPLK